MDGSSAQLILRHSAAPNSLAEVLSSAGGRVQQAVRQSWLLQLQKLVISFPNNSTLSKALGLGPKAIPVVSVPAIYMCNVNLPDSWCGFLHNHCHISVSCQCGGFGSSLFHYQVLEWVYLRVCPCSGDQSDALPCLCWIIVTWQGFGNCEIIFYCSILQLQKRY